MVFEFSNNILLKSEDFPLGIKQIIGNLKIEEIKSVRRDFLKLIK